MSVHLSLSVDSDIVVWDSEWKVDRRARQRGKSDVCTDYEWRQCAVTSMREACVRLVTHRLPAPRGVFTPE